MYILHFKDDQGNTVSKKAWANKKGDDFLKGYFDQSGENKDLVDFYECENHPSIFESQRPPEVVGYIPEVNGDFSVDIFEQKIKNGTLEETKVFSTISKKVLWPYNQAGEFVGFMEDV